MLRSGRSRVGVRSGLQRSSQGELSGGGEIISDLGFGAGLKLSRGWGLDEPCRVKLGPSSSCHPPRSGPDTPPPPHCLPAPLPSLPLSSHAYSTPTDPPWGNQQDYLTESSLACHPPWPWCHPLALLLGWRAQDLPDHPASFPSGSRNEGPQAGLPKSRI